MFVTIENRIINAERWRLADQPPSNRIQKIPEANAEGGANNRNTYCPGNGQEKKEFKMLPQEKVDEPRCYDIYTIKKIASTVSGEDFLKTRKERMPYQHLQTTIPLNQISGSKLCRTEEISRRRNPGQFSLYDAKLNFYAIGRGAR